MSAKGQVVIPKDVRDRLRLCPGDRLDVVETADGVLLRPSARREKFSVEETERRLRDILPPYKGPPVSVEEMGETIDRMWEESAGRSDCKGR